MKNLNYYNKKMKIIQIKILIGMMFYIYIYLKNEEIKINQVNDPLNRN